VNHNAADPTQLTDGAEIGSLLAIKTKQQRGERHHEADYGRLEQAPKR
jgi:hypothetical protein